MLYGIQLYLDNRKPAGGTWAFKWGPFAGETEMMPAIKAKGINHVRVMLVASNIQKDGGFAQYKAYDGRTCIAHFLDWQTLGLRTVLALRDYELIPIPERAELLKGIYRACRSAGLNPVFTLGNEPDTVWKKDYNPDGSVKKTYRRYDPNGELATCAGLVIPALRSEYPDLEWWGPDTATAGWFPTYYQQISKHSPNRRAVHTYDGNNTAGTELLGTEITEALEQLPKVTPDPWLMAEYIPYSKQYAVNSTEWTKQMRRYYDGLIAAGCDFIFFWVANTEPPAWVSTSQMRPDIEYALSLGAPPVALKVVKIEPAGGSSMTGSWDSVKLTYSNGTSEVRPS